MRKTLFSLLRAGLNWLDEKKSGTQGLVIGIIFLLVSGVGWIAGVAVNAVVNRWWPETSVTTGVLTAASEEDPPEVAEAKKNRPALKDALFVDMGSMIGITEKDRTVVVRRGNRNLLAVSRVESGITVDAILLDRNGDAIALIESNQFFVNPDRHFPRPTHPDKHTLVLSDLQGNEVLRVRLVNKNTLVVRGIWQGYGNKPLVISDAGVYVGSQGFERMSLHVQKNSNVEVMFGIAQ